jgi:phage gp45-like
MVPFNIGIPGSAVGTFSTPVPGSKVFVFFMGGDVQKPVYFAQAINPSDIKAITG